MTSLLQLDPKVLSIFTSAAEVFRPPTKLTVTEWAERERIISKESSAFGGRYHVGLAPYQRAMQDSIHIPGVKEVVFFLPSQMGKSLCMENMFGYLVDQDPDAVIWMWPTDKVAKEWSDDTLEPLIRDTPVLARKFKDGTRKSANKALAKKFPGGSLAVIGANSPAGLRRRRARAIFADEIDGYPASAGDEGDPIELVAARSETFWNKFRVVASTCTVKGESKVEARYEISNKQRWWVPCPHCSEAEGKISGFQVLQWKRLVFDKVAPHSGTVYPCEHCGAALTELNKAWMNQHGEWRAERPEIVDVQGFWLNKLNSPFVSWAELVGRFIAAQAELRGGNREVMKKFTTLDLAETWEERDEDLDREGLVKRRDHYPSLTLPNGVCVVTAGVDVQEDRLEVEVVGWGRGEESWSVAWHRIEGDTSRLDGSPGFPSVWERLDRFLDQDLPLQCGVKLPIAATFVDSGFRANEVYAFTRRMDRSRRIFASKGSSDFYHPPLKKFTTANRAHVKMYPVGVSTIKKTIRDRLRIEHAGPGFMHFTDAHNDADYFAQLTCETLKKKYEHGFPKRYWEKPDGARNEALDCRVYAYAAFLSLTENTTKMLEALRQRIIDDARKLSEQLARHEHPDQMKLIADASPIVTEEPVSAPAPEPLEENRAFSSEPPKNILRTPAVRVRSSWLRRF